MALGQEDLRFVFTVDPDTAKMQSAIKDVGKEMDKQVNSLKSSWDALSASGAKQLDSIQANRKIAEGFAEKALPEAINLRLEINKGITKELNQQLAVLERIKAETDPGVLRERVALEKQLAEAKTNYLEAHKDEQERQGIAQPGEGSNIAGIIGGGFRSISSFVLGSLGAVGTAIAGVATASVAAAYALKTMADSVAGFVAVASPGAFRQWEFVMRDISGVIGRTLIPVLYLFRDGARLLGDVLASILPSTEEMASALVPLREAFGDLSRDIRVLLAEFGPAIREGVLVGVALLVNQLTALARVAQVAAYAVRALYGPLAALFGTDEENRSSVGAAARPGGVATGEAYQRSNIESALNSFGGQQSIPQKQLGVLENILKVLQESSQGKQGGTTAGSFSVGVADGLDPLGIRRALLGW